MTYPDDGESDRGYVEYFYDNALRMISKVNQEALAVTVDYDSMGRALTRTKGGEIDAVGYSALGRMTLVRRGESGNLTKVSCISTTCLWSRQALCRNRKFLCGCSGRRRRQYGRKVHHAGLFPSAHHQYR